MKKQRLRPRGLWLLGAAAAVLLLCLTACKKPLPAPAQTAHTSIDVTATSPVPSQPPSGETQPVLPEPPAPDDSWKLILVNADHPLPEGFSVQLKQLRNGQAVDERI